MCYGLLCWCRKITKNINCTSILSTCLKSYQQLRLICDILFISTLSSIHTVLISCRITLPQSNSSFLSSSMIGFGSSELGCSIPKWLRTEEADDKSHSLVLEYSLVTSANISLFFLIFQIILRSLSTVGVIGTCSISLMLGSLKPTFLD